MAARLSASRAGRIGIVSPFVYSCTHATGFCVFMHAAKQPRVRACSQGYLCAHAGNSTFVFIDAGKGTSVFMIAGKGTCVFKNTVKAPIALILLE
jgi:hypothetical protein